MFGLWISFLDYQVVKVTILFIPILTILLGLYNLSTVLRVRGHSVWLIVQFFFSNIVRLFGVPIIVLHNRDLRFTSNFWKALWELLGIKVLFASAYHP